MSLVITVLSCHRDRDIGCHDCIRNTWGKEAKELGIDVFFFIGGECPTALAGDEFWLDVPDGYYDLPHKTKAVAAWLLSDTLYTYMLKCDNDTFLVPELLFNTGFWKTDYSGTPINEVYMHGGAGYFLSKRAAQIVAHSEVDEEAEDRWVGRMLSKVEKRDLGEAFWRRASWHYPVGIYGKRRYHPDSKWMETMACAHLGHTGYDPRGLCFQDRAENGHGEGEYRVLLMFPGHEDRIKILTEKELKFWQGHRLVREVLSPKW